MNKMTRRQAARILGIKVDASPAEIDAAYKKKFEAAHLTGAAALHILNAYAVMTTAVPDADLARVGRTNSVFDLSGAYRGAAALLYTLLYQMETLTTDEADIKKIADIKKNFRSVGKMNNLLVSSSYATVAVLIGTLGYKFANLDRTIPELYLIWAGMFVVFMIQEKLKDKMTDKLEKITEHARTLTQKLSEQHEKTK